jgi:hypothetical protein
MFRKGQNYRIFINNSVVAEETSCTVTRGVDTEDAANKDLAADSTYGNIGGANPVAMYKNMQFQVEAQGEGAILLFQSALLLMNTVGGAVGWAPTKGTNNRTPQGSLNAVKAICNDLTINAPNRQPVTCSAQFTAIPGVVDTYTEDNPNVPSFNVLRGEFLRLFLGGTNSFVIAQATNVSLHISLSMEDATTKDDTSASATTLDFKSQVPTQINYDISSECIYEGGLHTLTVGESYPWSLAKASGEGQATKGDMLVFGTAMLTNLTANAAVNQSITYSGTFTGVGVLNTPKTSNSLRNSESTATAEEEEQQEKE